MKIIQRLTAWLLFALMLFGICAGVFYSFQFMKDLIAGAGWPFEKNVTLVWASVLIAALMIGTSIRKVYRRKAKEQARLEKAHVYQDCLELLAARLRNGGTQNGAMAEAETAERALLIWGSNSVLKKYAACKQAFESKDKSRSNMEAAIEKLLKTVRIDLGHNAFGLGDGQMSELWLSTVEKKPSTFNKVVENECESPTGSTPARPGHNSKTARLSR